MAAAVTGGKTCLFAVSPAYTAAAITTLLATAPENMTVGQAKKLINILQHVPKGNSDEQIIGTLLI